MKRNRIALAVLAALGLAASASAAVAVSSSSRSDLRTARATTVRFQNVQRATAAGYALLRDAKKVACIQLAGEGGMGIHYVNGDLVGDGVIDLRKPEALVYERAGNKRRLVALEYVVFAEAWKEAAPPALFGRTFDYVPAGNRYGLPPFWALHAWVWK